ncbi:hypothetical protein HPP92_008458 [Vanilla planifolia]|uniref:GRAM domain-containing protein n=1 Tax=Vanilla planifolia TaxID=51239 RepID=A0A835R8W4_VANPL|nr:hypothetical protein HPP92_008458 [Vanilla planifolia]
MSNQNKKDVIGIPVNSTFEPEGQTHQHHLHFLQSRKDVMFDRLHNLRKKTNGYLHGIRDHVSLGSTISETLKGKLSLGTRILHARGLEGLFRKTFSMAEEEKLIKASQCYLSTTSGPVPGVLFISSEKVAFCSERLISLSSPTSAKAPYKVLVPLKKIKGAFLSENTHKPCQKYIYIATVDGYEFWFMGFVNYQKTFKLLQLTVSGR